MTVYFSSQARLAASRASPLVIDAFAKNTTRFRFPRTRVHTNAFAFCVSLAFKPRFHRVSLSRKRARVHLVRNAHALYIYTLPLYCIDISCMLAFLSHFTSMLCISLKILMSVLVGMIHAISMPHVSTLLVAMTVRFHGMWIQLFK